MIQTSLANASTFNSICFIKLICYFSKELKRDCQVYEAEGFRVNKLNFMIGMSAENGIKMIHRWKEKKRKAFPVYTGVTSRPMLGVNR